MCDFKPGDEVVCIKGGDWVGRAPRWMFWTRRRPAVGPTRGETYVVTYVGMGVDVIDQVPVLAVCLAGFRTGYHVARFRKVQRRDLAAWLATENTIEGPVRPHKRERV